MSDHPAERRNHQDPESLCAMSALPPSQRRVPSLLITIHRSYGLMRRSRHLSSPSAVASLEESLQVVISPCCQRDLLDVILRILPQMPEPLPRRSHRVHLPGSSSASSAFPWSSSGRLPASSREHDFPRTRFSRLQLFRYVQASKFACLPDRSYRCKFPCRAAEAFTSEQNVRRYLRTHRIC